MQRTGKNNAAVGSNGTHIKYRLLTNEYISQIKLGSIAGKETPLKLRNGMIATTNFSGHFRRLSAEAAEIFEKIVTDKQ